MTGTVFDIKEFSVHDGPGSRVTVFMKGCPLRCIWCHNPEGLKAEPQLMYRENMCCGCRECYKPCSHEECQKFGRCIYVCPGDCLSVSGRKYDSAELFEKLRGYKPFFSSGGGVTFSGGEPLMQAEFVCEVAQMLREYGIHTAVQTSGYTDEKKFRKVLDSIDYVMMDIKIAGREDHKKYTGVYNDIILKNFEYLRKSNKEYLIRVPLIPGITDTEENKNAILKITGDSPVEFLEYNSLAGAKYRMLGLKYELD